MNKLVTQLFIIMSKYYVFIELYVLCFQITASTVHGMPVSQQE